MRWIVGVLLLAASPAAFAGPWTEITTRDLDAIYKLIEENHPGPLDTEHPYFKKWMDEGMVEARRSAATAHNFRDYKRILLTYLTGFRDDHTRVDLLVDAARQEWPGFLPRLEEDGAVRVGTTSLPNVREGEKILSCDGLSLADLFKQRVAPVRWNSDIQSQLHLYFPRTLLIDYGDEDSRLHNCILDDGSGPRTINLEWRFMSNDAALDARQHAIGTTVPELGLRKVDGVWFLSMPSFNYWGSDSVTAFRDLQKQVEENVDDIRAGVLVLDVRGNRGGISDWANDIISTIWGREWVDAINSRVEEVVDWRASPSNLARIESFIKRMDIDGLDTTELKMDREAMTKALAKGQPFGRLITPAKPTPMPTSSPFTGRAYFLTDYWCVSACLNFADMVMRLPKVAHVGLSTGADALFIDTDSASLPSGMASLTYSNKVYRKQIRGNNEGYEPKYRWPGGQMTYESLAAWVLKLP
jgi:hypothetical protein